MRDAATRTLALKAMRALPAWKALQKQYLEAMEGAKGPWDRQRDAKVAVERWDLPTPLVTVTAYVDGRCGVFGGEVFAVYELHDGQLTLVAEPTALRPDGALLLDGAPVLVGKESWSDDVKARKLVPAGGRGPARQIDVPYSDGDC